MQKYIRSIEKTVIFKLIEVALPSLTLVFCGQVKVIPFGAEVQCIMILCYTTKHFQKY